MGLSERLPFWHMEADGLMVFKDGSLGCGWCLQGLDIGCADHGKINSGKSSRRRWDLITGTMLSLRKSNGKRENVDRERKSLLLKRVRFDHCRGNLSVINPVPVLPRNGRVGVSERHLFGVVWNRFILDKNRRFVP